MSKRSKRGEHHYGRTTAKSAVTAAAILLCAVASSTASATDAPSGANTRQRYTSPQPLSANPQPHAMTTRSAIYTDRATDGAQRPQTLRLLKSLIRSLGQGRASVYDQGDHFDVRVVTPTASDRAKVKTASSEASALLNTPDVVQLVTTDASDQWLIETSKRLSSLFPDQSVTIGVDLKTSKIETLLKPGQFSSSSRSTTESYILSQLSTLAKIGQTNHQVAPDLSPSAIITFAEGRPKPVDARNSTPLEGGRWVQTDSTYCTTGFLVSGGGHFRFTTAGHCFHQSSPNVWMYSGFYVGERTQYYPGGWDSANFSFPSSWNPKGAITVRPSGNYRKVVGSSNPLIPGQALCFEGRGSVNQGYQENCGTQVGVHNVGGKTLTCIDRKAYGGDSGGPVYYQKSNGDAVAKGTMAITYTSGPNWRACFNPIGQLSSAGNWSVVTWK